MCVNNSLLDKPSRSIWVMVFELLSEGPIAAVLLFELFEVWITFLGFMLFNCIYWKHPVYRECIAFFRRLPIYNRVPAIWFTLCFAIPNKVFVNNKINKVVLAFLIFLILFLAQVFIPFILFYLSFWVLVLESYVFALLYENNATIKKFIINKLFNGDVVFAEAYFRFF